MLPSADRDACVQGPSVNADRTPERVRVVRVFSRLNIGGPSVHVILLSADLRALGYQTRLVVGQSNVYLVSLP